MPWARRGPSRSRSSPLFQLLDDYPGISLSHDVTEAFRERAVWVSDLTIRANNAVKSSADGAEARERLLEIEKEYAALAGSEEQLMVMLMLAYRDISEWEDVIRVAESLPSRLRSIPTIREQMAMALSRRNQGDDRNRAIETLEEVIAEHGDSPESLGILARCHKARWEEKHKAGDPGAQDALDQAIHTYRRGFDADPRDFYPGVNLVTLPARRGKPEDIECLRQVAPVVNFAAGRKGGLRSRDYWVLATVLETSALTGDEEMGRRALSAMLDVDPAPWMCETTADNLDILVDSTWAGPAGGLGIRCVGDASRGSKRDGRPAQQMP
jgi:MAP3K TRAFs-binding domain